MTQAKRQLLINMKYWDNTYFDIDGKETSLASIIREVAELSFDGGFDESAEGWNAEFPSPCSPYAKLADKNLYAKTKEQFLKQLFEETEK
jgi:hypothetical protein